MRSPTVKRAVGLAALVVCGGCANYVLVSDAPSTASGDVRLTLSENAAGTSYGPIGSSVRQVEGTVVAANDSAISISVASVVRRTGLGESWSGEMVSIPRRSISSTEAKRFSFSRTLATVGAVVAGGLVARTAIGGGESTGSGAKKPGGGN
ncbi:MAG: hypothetical protein M3Z54_07385 [Gemmatimonadota bacterium]|nr:hypothetical protein [Gemmatimonadota bacterium]